MLRFALLTILLAFLVTAGVQAGVYWEWFDQPSYALKIVIFLSSTHLGLYSFVVQRLGQRPEEFVKIYLGITVLRILFFGIFIFAIIWLDPSGARENAVFFLINYFLFTGLEVSALFKKLNFSKPPKLGQKER